MKRKVFLLALFFLFSTCLPAGMAFYFFGCGYTTRGFITSKYKTVHVTPVMNNIEFTGETQEYSKFRSVPVRIENSFTKALLSRFNIDGLKTASEDKADLVIKSEITDFVRDVSRRDEDDNITEHILKIYVDYKIYNNRGELIKENNFISNREYAISGSLAETESQAISKLLDDAARRISEDIVEEW